MKASLKYLVLIALISFSSVLIASTPRETKVPVSHLYVPDGFDSNDNVEMVVSGILPNLCHKSPKTAVVRDKLEPNKLKIERTSL